MKDLYQEVTARIINELEQDIIPWAKHWIGSGTAVSHSTGKSYSFLNQMLPGNDGLAASLIFTNVLMGATAV